MTGQPDSPVAASSELAASSHRSGPAAFEGIPPVEDFATDWDFSDPAWVEDPYPLWQELRDGCPIAHSERFNEGIWLPLHYDDVVEIAHDTETFSNRHHGIRRGGTVDRGHLPPINSDPPEHREIRRLLLPFFAPRRIEGWREHIVADCTARAEAIAAAGHGDAAIGYAQHIPVGAIAAILGIDADDGDRFRGWINDILTVGTNDAQVMQRAMADTRAYMSEVMAQRREAPGEDLISELVQAEIDGAPLDDDLIERILVLQLVAGIDTTWSSIGSSLWHLAITPAHRQRLVDEPDLIPTAVEEFLRAYAPVNVARRVTKATTIRGVELSEGDHVMMAFPVACRDPKVFDRADEVVIDRTQNRHVAFGAGIHRCLGSNLARLEMEVSIRTWLEVIPEFSIAPGAAVEWATGQIRGPRTVPVVVG